MDPVMFELEDLKRTYIRAQDAEGKWGSFSLQELLDRKKYDSIGAWFGEKLRQAVGADEDGTLTPEATVNICRIVELVDGPLLKTKEQDDGERVPPTVES